LKLWVSNRMKNQTLSLSPSRDHEQHLADQTRAEHVKCVFRHGYTATHRCCLHVVAWQNLS